MILKGVKIMVMYPISITLLIFIEVCTCFGMLALFEIFSAKALQHS